ncbi:MAG: hypothetical protein KGL39_48105, partial [Patescibacteria group bacterium]|nr:hypothetical protein [Patescibacteria group bacterium]
MSELSRKARRANRAKAHRMATQQAGKVDCSSYGPEEDANTTTQTGMRPISRRNYKRGGKVEGEDAKHHAGKTPRKRADGGKITNKLSKEPVRDLLRQAASLSDKTVHGPGGSSYKRRPGSSRDIVETHHTGTGTERKLMGKTGKWNIDHTGRALPEWAEKHGPLPRKA